ncbi:HEPN domain-containing protein [Aestuariirhabdus sp. Z084]|uniref:HEPN domain-containing protein n=1 Tax=Aestuariirhabdus haliotis TaxID=2918751 RepID=UPI00201B4341|nr:HEPN domain-containing protein [Aestuariirhabdus haliotis]MCL6415315.1 HEPN domain-containing protein [Aestuariirhabdus haliotis]MCL6419575.1 HEPN domain-containing protein [Aestuariirhabdus haliotis]
MTLIEDTKIKLEEIFLNYGFNDKRKPHKEAFALAHYIKSKEFLAASKILKNNYIELSQPYLHLLAQSVELAIKGYMISCGEEPKKIHDLVKLTSKAEDLGLKLEQKEASSIVLLNHYFFQDLITETKFKTRYPTEFQEAIGGPVPDHNIVEGFYESISLQAKRRCDFLNQLM